METEEDDVAWVGILNSRISDCAASGDCLSVNQNQLENNKSIREQFKGVDADRMESLESLELGTESGRALSSSDEVWVVPMLVISAISVSIITIYQVLIIVRSYRSSPSRRHLFLSQVLLLGLLLGSSLGFPYALDRSRATCIAVRVGTGVSYVLIYSSLLVKLVFLLSLNIGVYLPAMYQALLFFFCVLVQGVITAQWNILKDGCDFSTTDHVLSLFYIFFLVVFVTSLAIKSKHIKDNYREGSFIFILMLVKIPVWLGWIISSVILPAEFHNVCFGFGLQVTCILTFVIMFLPRSRQLTAMGKEGLYLEDHEDQVSLHRHDTEEMSYNQAGQHQHSHHPSHYLHKKYKESSRYDRLRAGPQHHHQSDEIYQNGSYLGFHRPLGVIPPSTQPSASPHSRTPPSVYQLPRPKYPHYPAPYHAPAPAAYGAHFPSHFYPEKLYQYWHHYYPRIPGAYKRLDNEMLSSYYDRDRSKSKSPKPIFYKSPSPQRSHWGGYF